MIDKLVTNSMEKPPSQNVSEEIKIFYYLCHHCVYKTTDQNSCKTHIEFHDSLTYQCKQCNYKTSVQNNLKNHIESNHSIRNFSYNKCEYSAP